MASQHFVAFADRVLGLGHLDAAPFGCSAISRSTGFDYNKRCATGSAGAMAQYARKQAAAGKIADVAAMAKRPVWVMASDADTVVYPAVGVNAAAFYETFSDNVLLHRVPKAEHAFVVDYDCPTCNSCGQLKSPFINNCGYVCGPPSATCTLAHHQHAARHSGSPPPVCDVGDVACAVSSCC